PQSVTQNCTYTVSPARTSKFDVVMLIVCQSVVLGSSYSRRCSWKSVVRCVLTMKLTRRGAWLARTRASTRSSYSGLDSFSISRYWLTSRVVRVHQAWGWSGEASTLWRKYRWRGSSVMVGVPSPTMWNQPSKLVPSNESTNGAEEGTAAMDISLAKVCRREPGLASTEAPFWSEIHTARAVTPRLTLEPQRRRASPRPLWHARACKISGV